MQRWFSHEIHIYFVKKRFIHTIKSLMHLNIWLSYFLRYGFLILTNFSSKQSTAEHEDLKVILYTWITMRWWKFPGSFTLSRRKISFWYWYPLIVFTNCIDCILLHDSMTVKSTKITINEALVLSIHIKPEIRFLSDNDLGIQSGAN